MTATIATQLADATTKASFISGIQYLGQTQSELDRYGAAPVIKEGESRVADSTAVQAAYQTLLAADALRYLMLQMTGEKASGHPGGYASGAEAYAALWMLGHKNMVTEVGHHAPGFYSALFLDRSLEAMGIHTVSDLRARFRERHGLLGHLSGAIPGVLAPAGPLGQGQHFALAGALLNRDKLFPVSIGDGGLGEPYIMSAFQHFLTAYPATTNFLPVLIWNGYSQEHHSMVSTTNNDEMIAYWKAHGFKEVILVDARDYADAANVATYADSTAFPMANRIAFTSRVLSAMDEAAGKAMSGTPTCFIIKQLKGAGVHARGSKSHNLYPGDTLTATHMVDAMKQRALPEEAWKLVRTNFARAGGGPAAQTVVTELERNIAELAPLTLTHHAVGANAVPSTSMGSLVAQVGTQDADYIVTNADGNEASGLKVINDALKIRHPTTDPLYNQHPDGQVYEPLNEDACAGLAAGLALFGSRALWLSYESFAINGLPIVQTVAQAMAELRRKTPSLVCMYTAGALEQGRNGWTHQRPEVENYFAALMRNGNVYPVFPYDANCVQVAYDWAVRTHNKAIALFCSKTALPVYGDMASAQEAVETGATALYDSGNGRRGTVVFAVSGDMVLGPVMAAKTKLEIEGFRVRIVAVVNPRRLFRPSDVAWNTVAEADDKFMSDAEYETLFGGDMLIGVTGGASAILEPVMLRSRHRRRDMLCWKRGETTASPAELFALNGITEKDIVDRVWALSR